MSSRTAKLSDRDELCDPMVSNGVMTSCCDVVLSSEIVVVGKIASFVRVLLCASVVGSMDT